MGMCGLNRKRWMEWRRLFLFWCWGPTNLSYFMNIDASLRCKNNSIDRTTPLYANDFVSCISKATDKETKCERTHKIVYWTLFGNAYAHVLIFVLFCIWLLMVENVFFTCFMPRFCCYKTYFPWIPFAYAIAIAIDDDACWEEQLISLFSTHFHPILTISLWQMSTVRIVALFFPSNFVFRSHSTTVSTPMLEEGDCKTRYIHGKCALTPIIWTERKKEKTKTAYSTKFIDTIKYSLRCLSLAIVFCVWI